MTLFERLSRFNHRIALKVLGPHAEKLIMQGGAREIDIAAQVKLSRNVFRLSLPDAEQYINIRLHQHNFSKLVAEIRRDPNRHPCYSYIGPHQLNMSYY